MLTKKGPLSFMVSSIQNRAISKKELAANFTPLLVTSIIIIVASPLILLLCELIENPPVISTLAFILAFLLPLIGSVIFAIQMELAKMPLFGIAGGLILATFLGVMPWISEFSFVSKAMTAFATGYLALVYAGGKMGYDFSAIPEELIDD